MQGFKENQNVSSFIVHQLQWSLEGFPHWGKYSSSPLAMGFDLFYYTEFG